jgi:hypothetical protein
MKHIKRFENHKTNESSVLFVGGTGLLLWYGIMYGYVKIRTLFEFAKFKIAINKIEPIFDKIKDDEQIQSLIQELYKYKDDLRYGEDEHGQRRREGFKLRDAIYQRAKEILDEKEFNVFTSSAREFESGSEKPAGYFINKDDEFKGWGTSV